MILIAVIIVIIVVSLYLLFRSKEVVVDYSSNWIGNYSTKPGTLSTIPPREVLKIYKDNGIFMAFEDKTVPINILSADKATFMINGKTAEMTKSGINIVIDKDTTVNIDSKIMFHPVY